MSDKKIFPMVILDNAKRQSTLTKQTSTTEFMNKDNPKEQTQNVIKDHQTQILCPICLGEEMKLFAIGECEHKFCRVCCFAHINELILQNRKILCAQEGCQKQICTQERKEQKNCILFFSILEKSQKKKLNKYKKRIAKYQNPIKCAQCIYKQGSQNQRIQLCSSCQQLQLNLPKSIRKCSKCQKLLERIKGCNHFKCTCGYEFCFLCSKQWEQEHICQNRIVTRTGVSWLLCGIIKIVLGIIISVLLSIFWIFFIMCICLISGFLGGFIIFLKILQAIPKLQTNDCLKFILLLGSIAFLPLIWVISFAPSFFIPIINICWQQKVLLDPNMIRLITTKIFACLKVLSVI